MQEMFGLINYGEIWKKFGTKFDSKLCANLQQLVLNGHTVFKVKGKTVRVRTPVCNTLKKIHNIVRKFSNAFSSLIFQPFCFQLILVAMSIRIVFLKQLFPSKSQ